ncbi:KTSC domain-containing protein [Aureimonas sp. ME7]|uniref:KTSC domain-containing protein n=1 Tax=Aureimonas sp. ME7 TaxID=2744252 RepID=UPI0015F3BEEB|nr:KTSC domain-containing protein [Aureimonas sp. ME7]
MVPIAVQSRIIKSIRFDPSDGRLHLRLANGEERLFEGVTLGAVAELVEAPSPGTHYIQRFRREQRRVA